jgi:hypothetical protein
MIYVACRDCAERRCPSRADMFRDSLLAFVHDRPSPECSLHRPLSFHGIEGVPLSPAPPRAFTASR